MIEGLIGTGKYHLYIRESQFPDTEFVFAHMNLIGLDGEGQSPKDGGAELLLGDANPSDPGVC